MQRLSTERPLFHSEADLQHAVAWLIHGEHPDCTIRLEYPIRGTTRASYLDLLAVVGGERVAIELKYKTRALSTSINGEPFILKSHGAQDLGRYDYLLDVQRIEAAIETGVADRGWAILLSNDSAYWRASDTTGVAYEAFGLHPGRQVTG
jgi:hypothetical protein